MADITLLNVDYGPNPHYVRQGGNMFYKFDLSFSATPPAKFDYSVELQTVEGTPVRTLSGRVATQGQPVVPVSIHATSTTDLGDPLPLGHYRNVVTITVVTGLAAPGEGAAPAAAAYPPHQETICSGRQVNPEPCEECEDAACPVG